MRTPEVNDQVIYVPTAGPYKGKRCPAIVTEVVGPALVNLEVRSKEGHFVESVTNVPVSTQPAKPGKAEIPK